MNADAVADQFPFRPLFGGGAQRSRKPLQRSRDFAAISEYNMDGVLREPDVPRERLKFLGQR